MRVLVCDQHVVFAESLAHLIVSFGKQVAGVTHNIDEAIEVLGRESVDVCLLDSAFGKEKVAGRLAELREASPTTSFVLLAGEVDQELLAVARRAGVRGVADKRLPASGIVDLLDRVYAGESVVRVASITRAAATAASHRPGGEVGRLATSLTTRERQVLGALVRGDGTSKLARTLGVTSATARCHVQNVLTKLGAHSRLEAATSAVRYGMINPETGDWMMPDRRRSA